MWHLSLPLLWGCGHGIACVSLYGAAGMANAPCQLLLAEALTMPQRMDEALAWLADQGPDTPFSVRWPGRHGN